MSRQSSMSVKIDGLAAIRRHLAGFQEAALMTVSDRLRFAAFRVYAEILTRSPVGESRKVGGRVVTGGRYRAGWSPPDVRTGQHVVRATISNSVKYAMPVTYGSPKGGKPWPKAGPRTVEHNGRIYAKGGLPGERLARGGVVTPIFEGWADEAVKEILNGLRRRGLT